MTFLAALRHDRVSAPWLIDGPIDGQSFLQYVEKVLVPTLTPGDIVIIDNLGSHKGKAIRRAIRAAGAKLFFLPKYSPDLNPIEKFFAKLKHWLRRAARRTVDAVYNAIAEILPLTSPAECSNYFALAGYAQPQTITLSSLAHASASSIPFRPLRRPARADLKTLRERSYCAGHGHASDKAPWTSPPAPKCLFSG
jgi:transposase